MRVTVRTSGVEPILLGTGDRLVLGRAPAGLLDGDAATQLTLTLLTLPECAAHVSRLLGEVVVGDEVARLRWLGRPKATLSSLFDSPGGARRGGLTEGATAVLDSADNQVLVLRGRTDENGYADITIHIDVAGDDTSSTPYKPDTPSGMDWSALATATPEDLEVFSDTWYVALALTEPWLTGADDYPRPPTNREISERIRTWRGDSGRLSAPQRVHDAIQYLARLAFGSGNHPFAPSDGRRVENARYAVGRRAAEVGLVTVEQLAEVERQARTQRRDPAL